MGLFSKKKKISSQSTEQQTNVSGNEYIDDITFIKEMKHIAQDPWHQYDILIDARIYGWDMMLDWADYMAQADIKGISQVTVGQLGMQENDITDSYKKHMESCKNTPELNTEGSMLSIAGISETLGAPTKIVWINQTRVLRFFTLVGDESLINKYVETVIRRTFGTENAMKPAKPQP